MDTESQSQVDYAYSDGAQTTHKTIKNLSMLFYTALGKGLAGLGRCLQASTLRL